MTKVKGFVDFLYRHKLVRYLFVGGSTFVIDFTILVILHGRLGIQLVIATTISYWISIAYNFSLNRWWTFSSGERKSLNKHILAYGLLLAFNYAFTVLFVYFASKSISYTLAKVIAVVVQTSWTYYTYKNYVFVAKVSDFPPAAS